jgi:hypothetical protein
VNLYTAAGTGQRFGKHVPVARQQILNNATVVLQQWKRGVSTWSFPGCYKLAAIYSPGSFLVLISVTVSTHQGEMEALPNMCIYVTLLSQIQYNLSCDYKRESQCLNYGKLYMHGRCITCRIHLILNETQIVCYKERGCILEAPD